MRDAAFCRALWAAGLIVVCSSASHAQRGGSLSGAAGGGLHPIGVRLDEPVSRNLGLTPQTGSLPLWVTPPSQATLTLTGTARGSQASVMLVGHPDVGYGTAWVLSRKHRLLATNGHVADLMHEAGAMLAIRNGSTDTYQIDRVWYHPGIKRKLANTLPVQSVDPKDGDIVPLSPDVAVLHVAPGLELPGELTMGTEAEVFDLFADAVGMLGFPGYDTTSWPKQGEIPRATFHEGVVSRITDFQMNPNAPLSQLQCLQYTMSSWGGFSGSPVFLPNGHIIGLHHMSTKVSGRGMTEALAHGVRIDCLWELLVHHHLTDKVPIGVAESKLNLSRYEHSGAEETSFRKAVGMARASLQLWSQQKYSEAGKLASDAIALAPLYPDAYFLRAAIYAGYQKAYAASLSKTDRVQQLDWAIADIKKYIQMVPADAKGVLLYCGFLTSRNLVQTGSSTSPEAYETATKLLEARSLTDQEKSSAYLILAEAKLLRGTSLDLINKALALTPYDAQVYSVRASYWRLVGDSKQAGADASRNRQLVTALDQNLHAWGLATSADSQKRNGSRARELAEQACTATEYKHAPYVATLAAAYAASGDFTTAARWQATALALQPHDAPEWMHRMLRTFQAGKVYTE